MRCATLCLIVGCAGGASPEPPCASSVADGIVTVWAPAGRTVVFHDAHGAPLSQTTTNAGETALGVIPACGAVTAIDEKGARVTVTQLEPGDTVSLLPAPPVATGLARQLAVSFPLIPDASGYQLTPGTASEPCTCHSVFVTTSPAMVDLDACCVAADQTAAFTARAGGPWVLMYASLEGATGSTASIDAWRSDRYDVQLAFAHLDPTWSHGGSARQFAGAIAMQSIGITFFDGLGQITLANLGDQVLVSADGRAPDNEGSALVHRTYAAPLPPRIDLDADVDFPPLVTSVTRNDTDPGRPVVAWTTTRPTDTELAIVTVAGNWTLIAPASQPGAVRYPELPVDLSPPGTSATVTVVSSSQFADYAVARRQPLALVRPLDVLPRATLPGFSFRSSSGRIR